MIHKLEIGQTVKVDLLKTRNSRVNVMGRTNLWWQFTGQVDRPQDGQGHARVWTHRGDLYRVPVECITLVEGT